MSTNTKHIFLVVLPLVGLESITFDLLLELFTRIQKKHSLPYRVRIWAHSLKHVLCFLLGLPGHGGRWRQHRGSDVGERLQHVASGELKVQTTRMSHCCSRNNAISNHAVIILTPCQVSEYFSAVRAF